MKFPKEGSKYFHFRIKSLRMIGCWPKFGVNKSRFEKFYTFASAVLLGNYIIGSFFAFAGLVTSSSDVETLGVRELLDQIILFIIAVQVLSKMLVTTIKAQKMEKLIEDLNVHMHKEYVRRPEDEVTMKKCCVYDYKLSKFFFVISFVIAVISCLRPFAATIRQVLAVRHEHNVTTHIIGQLTTRYWFEIEATSPWYPFWYLQQLLMALPGGWCSWVSDSMFCGLLRYLCGHFDILIRNIRREEVDAEEKDEAERDRKAYEKLIVHHHYLISYTYELIKAFTPLMVAQLLLGAVTIGLVMIQINLTKGDPIQFAKPLAYITLKIVQLLLLSWNGQLLWDKSVEVGDAFFFTSWYEKPPENRKTVKMIIMRSQKPLKFANFGLQFSAPSFFHILNRAYSYYAMLRTMK